MDAVIYSTGNGDDNELEIYYKLCTVNEECFMTGSEAGGVGLVERLEVSRSDDEFKTDVDAIETSFNYVGEFKHDPKVCEGAAVCKYTFSTYNPSPLSQPRQVTLKVDIRTE